MLLDTDVPFCEIYWRSTSSFDQLIIILLKLKGQYEIQILTTSTRFSTTQDSERLFR